MWVITFSCEPALTLYRLPWPSWLQEPCVDSYHNHVPHLTKPPKHTFRPALLTHQNTCAHKHTHTHPHKNILCLLPLMLHTALLLSEREISSSVTDWSAVAVPRVRAAVSDRVWQISAATPLSRLVTSSVPTAITRPVSALHSSLICYRHSSGGAVHAGNSELLALTVYLWSRKCLKRAKKESGVNTCLLKETVALCVCHCYHNNTVSLHTTPSLTFRLDI